MIAPWRRHRAEMAGALRLRAQLRALFPGGLPEALGTWPGELVAPGLEDRVRDASRLLAYEGLATGDLGSYLEALETMAMADRPPEATDPLAFLSAWVRATARVPEVPLPLRALLPEEA